MKKNFLDPLRSGLLAEFLKDLFSLGQGRGTKGVSVAALILLSFASAKLLISFPIELHRLASRAMN